MNTETIPLSPALKDAIGAMQFLQPMDIARVCHEVNRAYCTALGDDSQVPWDSAPDWQKDSAMNGVLLHLRDHSAGPQASHESWMQEKLAAGWKYGHVKDPEKKEHPCIVSFHNLPRDQQAKDFIFRGVVLALEQYVAPGRAAEPNEPQPEEPQPDEPVAT